MYITVGLLQYIIHLCIRKHSGTARSPCDSGASCLLHWVATCSSCPCAGCISIRRHARPCGAVPRHVDVSRPQNLLALSSSLSQRLGLKPAPATACPFAVVRVPSTCRRARPCASIRVHAVQCAPMRLLVGPSGVTFIL